MITAKHDRCRNYLCVYEMWNRKGRQIEANEIQMKCASFLFFFLFAFTYFFGLSETGSNYVSLAVLDFGI